MIFVTVGTHEQQFNRMIQEVDRLKGKGIIEDEVVMQTGFSTYEPKHCKWSKLIPYEEMNANIEKARIVITHGGPASFIAPLQIGKIPIVVPRQKRYEEHVNDHQVEFCKAVEERMGNIIVVEDVKRLQEMILRYTDICKEKTGSNYSSNSEFNERFEKMVDEIWKKKNKIQL